MSKWGMMGWAAAAGSWLVAAPPQLRPMVALEAGVGMLAPGLHAIPCVADWNGDGRKDLLVGFRMQDKVALYLNVGTDAQPAFTNFTLLQVGGVDIQHPATGCGAPAPWVCDYDADGRQDLLVGTGSEGYVYFYRNTNTAAPPVLAAGTRLLVNGSPLTVTYRATPFVHDWDGDGLPDLLCGNGDGQVHFFRNVGAVGLPQYAPGVMLQAGERVLDFGDRSAVRVLDWDGDGVKDLVGSASYNVSWCRNVGSDQTPVLESPEPLRAPAPVVGMISINTSYRMRLELADWNNDGVTDLLVGDYLGYIYYFEGYQFGFSTVAVLPGNAVGLQWRSAPYLTYRVWNGTSPDSLDQLVATNLTSDGDATGWTNTVLNTQGYFRVELVP